MDSDWGWYFTSAETRTSMLRDELAAVRSLAGSQTSRLTSQLRTLQGSIETRLTALSAAFDAYVELGDIREQLAGFPDTTVVRRDVALAVDALAAGRRAERVDDRGEVYWLPHAANAVIGIVQGQPDEGAETTARSLSPQSELFVVAACGALGHGAAVADRVPALLTCDDRLSSDQLALWHGAVAGLYGPVLPAVHQVWERALQAGNADAGSWRAWTYEQARSRDVETTVDWIADRLGAGLRPAPEPMAPGPTDPDPTDPDPTGTSPTDTGPTDTNPTGTGLAAAGASGPASPGGPDAAAGLRAVVARLVGQGTDEEAPLIARARILRQRIENPGAPRTASAPADEASGTTVVDAVRTALVDPRSGDVESELTTWVADGLRAAAEAEAATLADLEPISQRVHTGDGEVDVTASGPQAGQVELVRRNLSARYPTSPVVSGVAAGAAALLLIGVVIAFALASGWAFVLVVLTIAVGVAAFRSERGRRERALTLRNQLSRLDTDVEEARQVAAARIDAREVTRTRVGAALERIRASAGAPEPV